MNGRSKKMIAVYGSEAYDLNMEIQYIVLIIGVAVLAIGGIFLALIGFTYTPKDQALVIEKMGVFFEVTKPGWSYRHPFIYHIVGKYSQLEEKAVNKIGNYSVEFSYMVADVKTFHYSGHCFLDQIMEKVKDKTDAKPEEIQNIILESAADAGVVVNDINIFIASNDGD